MLAKKSYHSRALNYMCFVRINSFIIFLNFSSMNSFTFSFDLITSTISMVLLLNLLVQID